MYVEKKELFEFISGHTGDKGSFESISNSSVINVALVHRDFYIFD